MSRVVIGVGNAERGDDGAGVHAVKRLRSPGLVAAAPFQLIELWDGAEDVVVVDAARSGAPVGTIHRFEAAAEPLPVGVLAASTHAFGIAQVVELARALGRLPMRLLVYGIEAGDVSVGARLSPEVESAVTSWVAEMDHA